MKQDRFTFLANQPEPFKVGVLLLLFIFILAGCNSSKPAVTITPTPSPTARMQFSSIDLGIPADAMNSPVVGSLTDDTLMHVRLLFKVSQSQQNQLNKISNQGQDLGKLANQIGISDTTFNQIKASLGIQGISLTLSKLHTSVQVDGKAKAMATLFQTHFEIHKYKGRTFYAPATPPQMPTFIANDLVSVTGLDSYSQPLQTGFQAQNTGQTSARANCNAPAGEDFPAGVASAYGYAQFARAGFLGDGMTINLVEIDGYPASDVANYTQCVGYRGHITIKNVDGAPKQAGEESALDIEQIAGLARDVNIVDYQTGNPNLSTGILDELQQIVDDNTKNTGSGSIVSISLEGAENFQSLNYLKGIDQLLSLLTQKEHMTVLVASGDCGAFMDHVFGSFSVSFPASDPNVVGVGGTVLQINQQGKRAGEIVWSNSSDTTQCTNSWGSGGGNSNFFQQPGFQTGKGVNNDAARGFREVPDVSAVALNLPLYFGGQWQTFSDGTGAGSGTSAATPIWATGMALVNQALLHKYHVFFAGPLVYYYVANHAGRLSPFFDVTQGNNLGFNATPGWDFATGLGTPNLVDFYNVLAGVASGH
ncbi:MAG TPA: S53 family peptidase [Ktedonobacteraceae bacterium]|nr:S53 family peptidase [Ktedonobacteraceae bacterium]